MAKRAAVKSEISDTLKPFYCTLCEKQFQNVAQYDEHTNSYAHHHKARLKDMQANARLVNQEELEKRKEKEQKREEKELRKLARAQGIKMAKPVAAAPSESDTVPTNETKPGGFKKAGWAAVTTAPKFPDTDGKRSGWAAVGPAPPLPTHTPPPPPDDPTPPASRSLLASSAPVFRAGGWTTLDSSSSQSVLPPSSPPAPLVPPPPPPAGAPPPSTFPSNHHKSHGCAPIPPSDALPLGRQSCAKIPDPHPSPQPLLPTSLRASLPRPPVAPTKSGWQQWKQGNNSKRR